MTRTIASGATMFLPSTLVSALVSTLFSILGPFAVAAVQAGTGPAHASLTTDRGLFVVSYESELDPLRINTMHTWVLRLTTPDGAPVTDAQIKVSGGMPVHDHGLPTAPRVTAEPEPGSYLLEGVRFHMTGSWEILVVISADSTRDRVTIPIQL